MNFVTIHRVFGLVHANPVRDFQGHVKTTIQNGTERQCIPSQAVKAHWRDAIAASPALVEIFAKTGTTVRSALIGKELIGKALVKAGLTEAEANAWGETTMRLFKKAAKDDKATDDKPAAKPAKGKNAPAQPETPDGSEDDVSEVLAEPEKDKRHILVLGSREIEALTVLALTAHKAGVAHKDLYKLVDKKSKRSGQPQAMLNALDTLDAMRAQPGFDGGLFGRFTTGCAVSIIDAAVHVGAATGVHASQTLSDAFTAQDQLQAKGESGAAHLSHRELGSAVYYLPVTIHLHQLRANFPVLDEGELRELVAVLVESLMRLSPAAMKSTTHAYATPGFGLAQVGHPQPVSLVEAFDEPVGANLSDAAGALLRFARETWEYVPSGTVIDIREHVNGSRDGRAVTRFAEAVAEAALPVASVRAASPASPASAARAVV